MVSISEIRAIRGLSLGLHFFLHHLRQFSQLIHQCFEFCESQRLLPVRQRFFGIRVNFDEQAIGAGGQRGFASGGHEFAIARAVRRIDDDWQMRQLFHCRHSQNVESVAGVSFKSPDTAFAEDDLLVALHENVLRSQQKFLQRRAHVAFQNDGLVGFAHFAQQVEIVHVARADTKNIHVFGQKLEVMYGENFGFDEKLGFLSDEPEKRDPFVADALKGVRRRARLKQRTAENLCAGFFYGARGDQRLFAAFQRAGSGDDGEMPLAQNHIIQTNEGVAAGFRLSDFGVF